MTDLERIRRDLVACRDIPWSCSCVEPEQLAALVEEVERLRADNAELELGVATMRARMAKAYEQRNDERAAVVAWLRASRSQQWANAIERSEHLTGVKP